MFLFLDLLNIYILFPQAGWTALVEASRNGHSQGVEILITEGANVNHQTKVITIYVYMQAHFICPYFTLGTLKV